MHHMRDLNSNSMNLMSHSLQSSQLVYRIRVTRLEKKVWASQQPTRRGDHFARTTHRTEHARGTDTLHERPDACHPRPISPRVCLASEQRAFLHLGARGRGAWACHALYRKRIPTNTLSCTVDASEAPNERKATGRARQGGERKVHGRAHFVLFDIHRTQPIRVYSCQHIRSDA